MLLICQPGKAWGKQEKTKLFTTNLFKTSREVSSVPGQNILSSVTSYQLPVTSADELKIITTRYNSLPLITEIDLL